MATFAYEALDPARNVQRGTVQAGTREQAVEQLRSMRLFPTSLREQAAPGSPGTTRPGGEGQTEREIWTRITRG